MSINNSNEPVVCLGGSAFQDNEINNTHPISHLKGREKTNFVSLTQWCAQNFISKKVGRNLIKKKLLIGQRLFGQWWVCANLNCYQELLDYLGIEQLFFDAENLI